MKKWSKKIKSQLVKLPAEVFENVINKWFDTFAVHLFYHIWIIYFLLVWFRFFFTYQIIKNEIQDSLNFRLKETYFSRDILKEDDFSRN